MILTGEAIRILQEKYPDKRIISGIDMTDFYAFQMWDRSVDSKNVLQFPIGPAMYAIRKSDGHEFFYHSFVGQEGTFAGEIDVKKYLNKEDVKFVKRIDKMLIGVGGE